MAPRLPELKGKIGSFESALIPTGLGSRGASVKIVIASFGRTPERFVELKKSGVLLCGGLGLSENCSTLKKSASEELHHVFSVIFKKKDNGKFEQLEAVTEFEKLY